MKRKVSTPTEVVQRAQRLYPDRLAAVKAYMGGVPYGKQLVDPRTADKQLTRMTPEEMYTLSVINPIAAEQAAARIEVLDARAAASPPLPGQDDFE